MRIRNLLKFFLGAALTTTVLSAYAQQAPNPSDCGPATSVTSTPYLQPLELRAGQVSSPLRQLVSTDPVGPFPLAVTIPFQWKSIQGIWTLALPGPRNQLPMYISFEVKSDCDGREFLQVRSFNPQTYEVIAYGVGLAVSDGMLVRAVMTSKASQHMLFIRQGTLSANEFGGPIETVVTMREFSGQVADVHMIARKASNLGFETYVERQKRSDVRRRGLTSR